MKMPWIRKLQTRLKTSKRKNDSDDDEDDDDDEGPSTGSNQGRSTKRRGGDLILPLLDQLNLLRKLMTKLQRNQGSLRHLLPNNIYLSPQLDGRSLT
ncbi:hypothetical protein Tco_0346883, partial [Tanacetum coccineum]